MFLAFTSTTIIAMFVTTQSVSHKVILVGVISTGICSISPKSLAPKMGGACFFCFGGTKRTTTSERLDFVSMI